MNTLKKIINQSKGHLDFWQNLEKTGGRLFFEEYVANYLKATLPGDTYWLGEDVVPPAVSETYDFSKILKGKRSLGCDIINIYNDTATGYESKWFDEKESIVLKTVSDKNQVIRETKIDQLIFVTNAKRPSSGVIEFASELGFMFQECWMKKEVFDTVKAFVNTTKKRDYQALKPRDTFFQSALDGLKTDVDSRFIGISYSDILVRIFQHWPAASGKGSFPRLAYDTIFEPRWDYKDGYPINLIENPSLAVLKGNLVKNIQHDLALKNNVIHIIFAGDIGKGAKDTEELQSIRTLAKVFTKKSEFIDYVRKNNNKTIWVHTTPHSYSRDKNGLAQLMAPLKRHFYFGHLDEVHHLVQSDHSTWTHGLDDNVCKIQIRFMTSANKKIADGKGSTYSMDHPDFSDIQVKDLDEKTAVALGYKRDCKIIQYIYGTEDFPKHWLETFEKKGQPLIKVKGTNMVVPMNWFMAVDSLLRFRSEYSHINHTKLTLNLIDDCVSFKKFFEKVRPNILLDLYGSADNEHYQRFMKAKIMVADTHSNSTVKILKEVEAIPGTHKDSFLIHCKLLGEGWDPENGWIDSTMFVSPTWSEIRIYQDFNRGSRIGDGSKTINYLVMSHLKELGEESTPERNFNAMFNRIKHIGEVLEIGIEDIKEKVIFKEFKRMPKGTKGPKQDGDDTDSYMDELESTFFHNAFDQYVRDGKYFVYQGLLNEMIEKYQKEFTARHLEDWRSEGGPNFRRRKLLRKEIIAEYIEYFQQWVPEARHKRLLDILIGEDKQVNPDTTLRILEYRDKVKQIADMRSKFMRKFFKDFKNEQGEEPSQEDMKKAYIAKFGEPKQVGIEPLIGKEHYFWRPNNKVWEQRHNGAEPDFRNYEGWDWQFDPFVLDDEWTTNEDHKKDPMFHHSDYI